MSTIDTNLLSVDNKINPPEDNILTKYHTKKKNVRLHVQDNMNPFNLQKNFFNLLIAQIKNQDPTNPIKNSDLTSQLAQINIANGVERLNIVAGQFAQQMNNSQNIQLSSLIGRHVIVPNKKIIHTKDTPTTFGIELFNKADSVKITITDQNNTVVHVKTIKSKNIEPGIHTFVWNGKNVKDESVDSGKYNISVVATHKDKDVPVTSLSEAVVHSIIMSSNVPIIDLGEAGKITPSKICEVLQ